MFCAKNDRPKSRNFNQNPLPFAAGLAYFFCKNTFIIKYSGQFLILPIRFGELHFKGLHNFDELFVFQPMNCNSPIFAAIPFTFDFQLTDDFSWKCKAEIEHHRATGA